MLDRIKRVINPAARLTLGVHRCIHILRHVKYLLGCLPVNGRIEFKLATLAFKSLYNVCVTATSNPSLEFVQLILLLSILLHFFVTIYLNESSSHHTREPLF